MVQILPVTPVANVLIGATAAVVGAKILRPAIVGVVRAGLSTKEYVESVWSAAKDEVKGIQAEAESGRVQTIEAELKALREEMAQLKAAKKS